MNAKDIITEEVAYLDITADGNDASALFEELKVAHLPIIEDGKFAGILAENRLYDIDDWSLALKNCTHLFTPQYAQIDEHSLQVMQKMSTNQLSVLPVVEEELAYVGSVIDRDLFQLLGNISFIKDVGAILVLEVLIIDYSLSEITRLIESNSVKILGSYISAKPDNRNIEVTLKLNKTNVDGVIQTLERYDYKIVRTIHQSLIDDGLSNRFNNLMKYLDL